MAKLEKVFGSFRLIAAITGICVIFMGISAWSSSSPRQEPSQPRQKSDAERIEELKARYKAVKDPIKTEDIKVLSKAPKFKLVGMEKTPSKYLRISLKNEYTKKITAFKYSVGSTIVNTDYLSSEIEGDGILSGATMEIVEPIDTELPHAGIVIYAVGFEDDTFAGHRKSVQELKDYRAGTRMVIAFVTSLLRNATNLPDAELATELERIKSVINAQLDEPDNARSDYFKNGYIGMKLDVLGDIERLQQDTGHEVLTQPEQVTQIRAKLTFWVNLYEKQ